jgi:hypothetical protein
MIMKQLLNVEAAFLFSSTASSFRTGQSKKEQLKLLL